MADEPVGEDEDKLVHDEYDDGSDNDEDQNPDLIPGADDAVPTNGDNDDDGA